MSSRVHFHEELETYELQLLTMGELAGTAVRKAVDAILQHDDALAGEVIEGDDEVDALYDQVYRELLTYMLQDPKTIQRATHLLWVAHDLERTADRATNIAELVIYLVTGKMTESNVSRY